MNMNTNEAGFLAALKAAAGDKAVRTGAEIPAAALNDWSTEQGGTPLALVTPKNTQAVSAIMATCQQCFQRLPEVYVLAIRGYEFELAMGLTPAAQRNLDGATAHLRGKHRS